MKRNQIICTLVLSVPATLVTTIATPALYSRHIMQFTIIIYHSYFWSISDVDKGRLIMCQCNFTKYNEEQDGDANITLTLMVSRIGSYVFGFGKVQKKRKTNQPIYCLSFQYLTFNMIFKHQMKEYRGSLLLSCFVSSNTMSHHVV